MSRLLDLQVVVVVIPTPISSIVKLVNFNVISLRHLIQVPPLGFFDVLKKEQLRTSFSCYFLPPVPPIPRQLHPLRKKN